MQNKIIQQINHHIFFTCNIATLKKFSDKPFEIIYLMKFIRNNNMFSFYSSL